MAFDAQRETMVAALAGAYSLAMPRQPIGGIVGQMLGNSVGSSLEFQDHRNYTPGDDLRHIDWSAYARTDQLTVRLYREEVSPRLEIIVDVTGSMTTGDKESLLRSLVLLLVRLADKGRAQPILWLVGDDVRREHSDLSAAVERFELTGRTDLPVHLGGGTMGLRPRSIRVVISDFLFPHDAEALVRRVADGAAALTLIQVLSSAEADPPVGQPSRLIDVETSTKLDVMLDAPTVARYLRRLAALETALARAARRAGGHFVRVTDARDLPTICREDLVPAGLLEVN